MTRTSYLTDLTDKQWSLIEPMVPPDLTGPAGGWPREVDMHSVFNGIFYLNRTGCAGRLAKKRFKPVAEIVRRSDDTKGFVVLPKRWIVEPTFGWFSKYRRLSKDYETLPKNRVAMIHIAMINLMLHRI